MSIRPALDLHVEALRAQMLVIPERVAGLGPDPDDMKLIEVAHSVPERTVVTGNLADFPDKVLSGVRLLTPVQALAELVRTVQGRD